MLKEDPNTKLFHSFFTHISLNTVRPRQNEQHFADDIFKRIFVNENVWISIKISLKFVPKGQTNNIPALVPIMAWRRSGDKPLSEPMIVHRRIYASLCLNQLNIITETHNQNKHKSYMLKPCIEILTQIMIEEKTSCTRIFFHEIPHHCKREPLADHKGIHRSWKEGYILEAMFNSCQIIAM